MKLFHQHEWDMWSTLVPSYRGHNTQFRRCKTCGEIGFRDLGYCEGANYADANKALAQMRDKE